MSGSQDEQLDCPKNREKLLYLQVMVCFSYLTADSIGSCPAIPAVTLGGYAYDVGLKVNCECYDKHITDFLLYTIIPVMHRSRGNIE